MKATKKRRSDMADDSGRERQAAPLSLEDCRCPVCLEIFLEPVTLPCTHTFCKGCFLESVDKAALTCPLCRQRVSTWARLNSRKNTLVNEQLWRQIQTSFPEQCERRRVGQENQDDLEVSVFFPTVSQPGELRQEYQDQMSKLSEEKRVLDEEERKASEVFIQRLLAEEKEQQREETRRREEDERLARQLSSELNSNQQSPESTTVKKKVVAPGQIEKFLSPRPFKASTDCSSASTFMSNKENIVIPDGIETLHRNQLTTQSQFTKKRSSEVEATDNEEATAKRGCHSPTLPQGAVLTPPAESAWELQLLNRQQQEEEDRRLALLLQKKLDREEYRIGRDRSKGSPNAYALRPERREGSGPCTTTPNSVRRRSAPSTSASSSTSSIGAKQKTLTEMFSSR